jgi:hypothetical protein
MTKRKTIAAVPSGRTHVCSTCGKIDNWKDGWVWFGSYRQIEDEPEKILKFCCESCMTVGQREHKLPELAE